MARLLDVKNLKTHFFTEEGVVRAVDGVTWHVDEGETLALVGESGCGKSVTAMSILRLIPSPPGRIVDGEIVFEGQNLLEASDEEMRAIRGNRISMVFQEPMTSLNPVLTIGQQIRESIILHLGLNEQESTQRSIELLELVGMLNLAKTNPEWLGFAMEGYVFAAIIFWIICYAMSKYSYNLELKYKTER